MAYGTLAVSDLLATQATVVQLGEDRVFEAIDLALQVHNEQLKEKVKNLMEVTSDRARRYGGVDTMTMESVDEYGTGNAQKITAGSRVEFPMYLSELSVQWTRKYMQNARAQELAEQFIAAQDADIRKIDKDVKTALFTSTNKTVTDRLVDNMTLHVKALANADSAPIPIAPDGTTFNAATHNHYMYTAGTSLAYTDVDALVLNVVEHAIAGDLKIYINRAQASTFSGLTGFEPFKPIMVGDGGGTNRFIPATTSDVVVGNYDKRQINNRIIGYYGSDWAEVWIKPWIPAGYLLAYISGNEQYGAMKPLVMRTRDGQQGDLVIAADDEDHPLRARTLEREFGIGVQNRVGAAVQYIDTGAGGVYVVPTF